MLVPRPYRYGLRPVRQTEEEDTGELQPSSVTLRGLADQLLRERGTRPIVQFSKPLGRRRKGAM